MKLPVSMRLGAVAALAMLPAAVRADDAAVRKALQANYAKFGAAFHDDKPQVMASLMTADSTLTTPDHQTWKRDRILADFKQQMAHMKDATWRRTITGLKVEGNQAMATVKGTFHGAFTGRDGKSHTFDLDSLTVDTWVRAGGGWKLKHADAKQLSPKIDGKSMAGR